MNEVRECKVVLLGQENTGKSCLVDRFVHGRYNGAARIATIGASYAAKKLITSSGEVVVSLWDTAGAERFDSLSRLYYSGAKAAIVCIDPSSSDSFSKAQFWAKELKQHQSDCKCYVVLSKCDLLKNPPQQLPPLHNPKDVAADAQRQEAAICQGSAYPGRVQDTAGNSSEWVGEEGEKASIKLLCAGQDPSEDALPNAEEINTSKSGQDAKPHCVEDTLEAGNTALSCPHMEREAENGTGTPWKRKQVSDAQIQAVVTSLDAKIAATSALTGQGVMELFQMIAEDLAESLPPPQEAAVTPRVTSHASLQQIEDRQAVTPRGSARQTPPQNKAPSCCS